MTATDVNSTRQCLLTALPTSLSTKHNELKADPIHSTGSLKPNKCGCRQSESSGYSLRLKDMGDDEIKNY